MLTIYLFSQAIIQQTGAALVSRSPKPLTIIAWQLRLATDKLKHTHRQVENS